jgi:serine/threonine protein kinase
MTVFQTMQCGQCGRVRAAQTAPLGLCPSCLLATALAMDDGPCPYQVLAPIGAGASGVTYLAQALTGLGGYVALKILKPGLDADAVLARYRHWKEALAGLKHPSVAPLRDAGLTADGMVYLASGYAAGWPLTAIASHPSIGRTERIELTGQLVSALDAARQAGVMHLKLDCSKVKVSNVAGVHATIVGLGSHTIINGPDSVAGGPDADRRALAKIICQLGVEP